MAKKTTIAATEHKLEGFAEDLGTLLASATNKAEGWLSQRKAIVKHLTEVRDTASKLLTDLGHQASTAVAAGTKAYKRRGRPVGSKNKGSDNAIIFVGGKTNKKISQTAEQVVNKLRGMGSQAAEFVRPRRTMSAKARKAISRAQKKRWALQKAGKT
jgi:ElaB/YqjD/DUF883 family membrane-anchored ribosome-binding protein